MNFFKKINIGALLTIIVLAIVVVYSVNVEIGRKSDKEQIESVIVKYNEFLNKYTMLEESKRIVPLEIKDSEYETYLSEMKKELKEIFVDDEQLFNNQYKILKSVIDEQAKNKEYLITKFKRSFVKVSSYEFFENTSKVETEGRVDLTYLNNITAKDKAEIKENNQTNQKTIDTLNFKKVDGKWKITYANITNMLPGSNKDGTYINDTMMMF